MQRRDFITLLGWVAATWPFAVRAQQPERMRRLGVLIGYAEDDAEAQSWLAAFRHSLTNAGWVVGRNIQIDVRWGSGDLERIKQSAAELVALKPDVILAHTTPVTAAFERETVAIPIVFVNVSDPVGDGFVASLARPGGNITGFINFEDTMGGKWLELLKQVSPSITHAAMMFNPETAPRHGNYVLPSFESAGSKIGIRTSAARVQSLAGIERAIADLAAEPGGGLVVMNDAFLTARRKEVAAFAATYKVPAIYPLIASAREGGLLAYAPDYLDLFARAASYVDRVLKGESPSALPTQVPTKYQLLINLKTAKVLGLTIPPMLLATADEVIE